MTRSSQGWLICAVLCGAALSSGCRQPVLPWMARRVQTLPPTPGELVRQIGSPPAAEPSRLPDCPPADAETEIAERADESRSPSDPRLRLVSFQQSESPVQAFAPVPPEPLQTEPLIEPLPPPTDADSAGAAPLKEESLPLSLTEVLLSVADHYPLLRSALAERQIASGKVLAAAGEFDTGVKGYSIAGPMGFYKNYRSLVGLSQPLVSGGYLFGGYKIGDGSFQPWYGERETNEGGEFSLGMAVPLWQNRQIDKRRAGLAQAQLARQAVDPAIQAMWLDFARAAAQTYWSWVAAGKSYEAQQTLLDLAESRIEQIEERVRLGDLQQIATIDNRRLIALRETKLIEARRKFQAATIKLSLFLRDAGGEPILVDADRVPSDFPGHDPPSEDRLQEDINRALAARPELRELDLVIRQTRVELEAARNLLRPKLDATLGASKDVGREANSKGDKTPFELEAGLLAEVPLQRREARGKMQAARGKLAQLTAKREFVVNKTTAAVQDAFSALIAAADRSDRAQTNVELAQQALDLGYEAFRAGDIDLIVLNIYEQAVTDAQLVWIEAQADYFAALADYDAILVRDLSVE